MTTEIIAATIDNIDELSVLFDSYRVFYQQKSDIPKAKEFLKERFTHKESQIFLGYVDKKPSGFVQLYPIFSSVQTKKMYLLNDLFVANTARKNGLAGELLKSAEEFAKNTGASGLILETTSDNTPAQNLYVKSGWNKSDSYFYTKNT